MESLHSVKRIALFSSYFESPRIPSYVFFYLSQLRLHVETLVYITTDDKELVREDVERLKLHVDDIVQVQNSGYDFGMWQKILPKYDVLNHYDELCLVNDSCVCIGSLSPYFEWHNATSADVTSMTLSYEAGRHAQSFFLCVKKPALAAVVCYLDDLVLHDSSFEQVIFFGELGLSQMLQERSFTIQGFYEMPVSDRTNPMYSRCIDIVRAGVPFVKKKLFSRYSSPMIKQLLNRKSSWHHEAMIDEVRSQTQLSEEMIQELFAWRIPYRMGMKERFRIVRLCSEQKVAFFFKKFSQ